MSICAAGQEGLVGGRIEKVAGREGEASGQEGLVGGRMEKAAGQAG